MLYKKFEINGKSFPLAVSQTGVGKPTTKTEGSVGIFYMDTTNGDVYKCTKAEVGNYTWEMLKTDAQNVPEWAMQSQKPTYTAQEVGAVDKADLQTAVDGALKQAKESGLFDGKDGVTPNIKIGTVETLAPGEKATASITGPAESPLLNLGIPAGKDGEGGANRRFFSHTVTQEEEDQKLTRIMVQIAKSRDETLGIGLIHGALSFAPRAATSTTTKSFVVVADVGEIVSTLYYDRQTEETKGITKGYFTADLIRGAENNTVIYKSLFNRPVSAETSGFNSHNTTPTMMMGTAQVRYNWYYLRLSISGDHLRKGDAFEVEIQ